MKQIYSILWLWVMLALGELCLGILHTLSLFHTGIFQCQSFLSWQYSTWEDILHPLINAYQHPCEAELGIIHYQELKMY